LVFQSASVASLTIIKYQHSIKPSTLVAIQLKTLIIISFLIVGQCKAFGQIPEIRHNYVKQDSTENPLIDSFTKQYDFVIAYTEQSYWWSDRKSYKILAFSDDNWTYWTYSDYFIQWTKKKRQKKVIIDTVRNGQFFKGKGKLENTSVLQLLSALSRNDFWTLNNDSLNQTRIIETRIENGDTINRKASISDGINYRFDIITKDRLRVIESYEPGYFLKLFPDMADRRKFMNSKDSFLKWWDKYCH
jgi:hypothetical protein